MSFASVLLRPFAPPIHTIAHYSAHKFRKDVFAGITVSVVEVPQAMAYALIAGVPPQYGLYTSILQGIVGAMLSSSEHMTTGPTNTQALLTASAAPWPWFRCTRNCSRARTLTGCSTWKSCLRSRCSRGLIQLIFAAARMGDMVRYVSRSVIAGLTAGAGVLIIFGNSPASWACATLR